MKKQRKVAESGHAGESQPAPGQEATLPSGADKPEHPPPRKPGRFRFDLLVLIAVVLLINIPFLAGHCMPAHDTKFALGVFDFFYSNYLFAGELPRWMAYGIYGLDASLFHITFMSGASYLAMFAGKFLLIKDSLFLFSITLCLEQLLLLFGLYLLCRRLFQERLTVFCVCLTMVCTVMWDSQVSLNFRLYYLLPLEFYCLVRLKQDEQGCFGWLAGVVAILGPLGSAPYFYPLWAMIITIFSLALFWGRFRALKCMVELSPLNLLCGICFIVLALSFAGSLSKTLENMAYLSRDRQGESGAVTLGSFVTYGGNDLGDMWRSLLLPSANVADFSGRMGMTDYVGLVTLLCLPLAWGCLRTAPGRSFAILTAAVFAFTRGGMLASLAFYFPGMHMFRHIGFMTALIKLLALIVAGYGLDTLIRALRNGTLAKYVNGRTLFLALLAIVFYLDLYIGGRVWGDALGSDQPILPNVTPTIIPSPLYPFLRAVLLAIFVLAVWSSCQRVEAKTVRKPNYVLFFLLLCLGGDAALFQFEMFSLLHPASTRIAFPTLKPNTSLVRSDEMPSEIFSKYQVWSSTKAAENQIGISAGLQWDPLVPHFRTDLFPKNVKNVMDILIRVDTNDLVAICKPKFRLLNQTTQVGSDEEALALLKSQTGWDTRLLLTDGTNNGTPNSDAAALSPDDTLSLDDFSADSVSLSVSNASSEPVWLVYSDSYSPGWHATVNGKPEPILKAYTAFKAIRLGSGNNAVRLNYDDGLPSTCITVFAVASGLATVFALLCLGWLAVREPFTG